MKQVWKLQKISICHTNRRCQTERQFIIVPFGETNKRPMCLDILLENKLGHWPYWPSSRSCTYTLFLPQGVKIDIIFALPALVSKIRANFQNCHIWAWNLAIGQSSRSCTHTLFLSHGDESELIFALEATASEIWVIFQNCHIWQWNFAIGQVPEVAHILSFYPKGSKLSLFALYGQWFPTYGAIFKLAIFGLETCRLTKDPEVAHTVVPLF